VWQFWQERFKLPWGLRELCAGCGAPETGIVGSRNRSHEIVTPAISLLIKVFQSLTGPVTSLMLSALQKAILCPMRIGLYPEVLKLR
jgi:hypothetical protein